MTKTKVQEQKMTMPKHDVASNVVKLASFSTGVKYKE